MIPREKRAKHQRLHNLCSDLETLLKLTVDEIPTCDDKISEGKRKGRKEQESFWLKLRSKVTDFEDTLTRKIRSVRVVLDRFEDALGKTKAGKSKLRCTKKNQKKADRKKQASTVKKNMLSYLKRSNKANMSRVISSKDRFYHALRVV